MEERAATIERVGIASVAEKRQRNPSLASVSSPRLSWCGIAIRLVNIET